MVREGGLTTHAEEAPRTAVSQVEKRAPRGIVFGIVAVLAQ